MPSKKRSTLPPDYFSKIRDAPEELRKHTRRPRRPAAARKDRMAFQLPAKLCERARNAVSHLAGTPGHTTLSQLCEQGLTRGVERLERKFNDGKPFPRRRRARSARASRRQRQVRDRRPRRRLSPNTNVAGTTS